MVTKKLTPQQIRVQDEKTLARKSKIEDLLMDAETIKQQIDKEYSAKIESNKIFAKSISALETKQNKSKRLIRYKREQIVSRSKK